MREEHWWDNLLWVLIFLFLVPSGLIVASWDSLPGSRLYKVKLFAEDAMVGLSFSNSAKSELEVAFADKRLSDATEMLAQSESAEGLEYFRKQMEDAKQALAKAPDGSAKEELTAKYLTALQNASHQLEQQKQVISSAHNIVSPPRTKKATENSASVAPRTREVIVVKEVTKYNEVTKVNEVTRVNVVTQVNEVTNVTNVTNVISQIDHTQDQITNIIQEVQGGILNDQVILPTATPDFDPTATQAPTSAPISACVLRCEANTMVPTSICMGWCSSVDSGSKQCPEICHDLEESSLKQKCRYIICQENN